MPSPIHILVVDDEQSVERLILQRFKKKIRQKEYAFIFASDGLEALKCLKENPHIKIILCDINMPKMDGITLLSKIKAAQLNVRTIMVSAYGDMNNIRLTMNQGAFDFLIKPINFDDLKNTIEKTIADVGTIFKAEKAEELEEENQQLNELDQLKTRLFTNISHELRTPLTIIRGMAEQIKDYPNQWLDRGVKMIQRNSNHLLDLVNQILDLRKLEMGKLELNLVQGDIVKYLKYILESFYSIAEQKDIDLQFKSDTESLDMDYDPEKLLRVLTNLLSNAIKFTPEGGNVTLIVNQNTSNQLEVQVADSGIGIPSTQLNQIFDRFYQVKEEGRKEKNAVGGTGIGLAIVKEMVQLMKGNLKVHSQVDEGTTFFIFIPIQNLAELDASNGVPIKLGTHHLSETEPVLSFEVGEDLSKVLIVEDNPDIAQYLIACLEGKFQMTWVKNGRKGLEEAIEKVPDLILSDVMMPEMDGYELCSSLKKDNRTSHIPIVLLTAKADEDSRVEGLGKGADAFLAKPFNRSELLLTIQNLLNLRQQIQARYGNVDEWPDSKGQVEDEFIVRIKSEIESNIDDEYFGINELCRAIGMSRAQIHRKVKALTGQSTSIFIRQIRLNKAKKLLKSTDLNIAQVAFEVGFRDPKYFSKTFIEAFGQKPKDFKQSMQQ